MTFTPIDSGKVTSKTTKASVRNGSCKWSDPIYETTRLLQDPKTKDYDEKLYKLVVAMVLKPPWTCSYAKISHMIQLFTENLF